MSTMLHPFVERTYVTTNSPWGSEHCHELPSSATVSPSLSSWKCRYGNRQYRRRDTTWGIPNFGIFARALRHVWSCHYTICSTNAPFHSYSVCVRTKCMSWRKCFNLLRKLFFSKEAQNQYCLWMKIPCDYKHKFDFQDYFLFFTSTDSCTANKAFVRKVPLKILIFPFRSEFRRDTALYQIKLLAGMKKDKPIMQ